VPICLKQLGFSTILASGSIFSIAHAGIDNEQNQPMDEHVTISAATDFTGIHPGASGVLAITFDIEEDWHTYWPGVSDSGFGIKLAINTSDEITLGEPIWPTPERYLQPGDILDHVYEDSAMVLVPFTIADDASPDDLLIFDINADYLVCKEVCLPGKASTSTSITILDESTEQTPSSSTDQIRKAYENRPKAFYPQAEDVRVQWASNAAAIMFRDATKIEFFPSKECTELADPIAGGSTDSNRLIIKFTQKNKKILTGRIRSYERSGIIEYDISIHAPDS